MGKYITDGPMINEKIFIDFGYNHIFNVQLQYVLKYKFNVLPNYEIIILDTSVMYICMQNAY